MNETRDTLESMGVDVFVPDSKREQKMAEALEAFSAFVLVDEKEMCQELLYEHLGKSVGELQGGSDKHDIYRVSITADENDAAALMLKEFRSSHQGRRYANVLSFDKLQQYMLGMCDKRSRSRNCSSYSQLGNLMFILAFGPTNGQVRHIDNMVSNIQVCLYMSSDCPSTVVYSLEEPIISNTSELIDSWEINCAVPQLVRDILVEKGNAPLGQTWYTMYFSFWETINTTLKCFGKLYQPISRSFCLRTDPGTTLVAGGNEVHAGPPTDGSRMFAFAIGIPDYDSSANPSEEDEPGGEDNNGEVQYSPVLLHVDLCSILCTFMEFEYSDRHEEHKESKLFLVRYLVTLLEEYPVETYARVLGDDRKCVRDWIQTLVSKRNDQDEVNLLVQEGVDSEFVFHSPDVCNNPKRRAKTKKKRSKTSKR